MQIAGKILLLFVSLALLNGCKKAYSPLTGVWEVRENRQTYEFVSRTIVSPNGEYVSYQTNTCFDGKTTNIIVYTIEGSYQMKDDFVIDTVRKHSSPKFIVPDVFKGRIVSFDAHRLCLSDSKDTNNSRITVLRRIQP